MQNIMSQSKQNNFLYNKKQYFSELCPQEPIIPANNQKEQNSIFSSTRDNINFGSQKFRVKKLHQTRQMFHHKSYEQIQHEREMKSMKQRIKNCKCLSQRKKDHFDPIMYPTYFVRNQFQAKDISLQTYSRRILGTLLTKQILKSTNRQKDLSFDKKQIDKKKRKNSKQVNQQELNKNQQFKFQNPSNSSYVNRVQKYQYSRNKDLINQDKKRKNSQYNYEKDENQTNFSLKSSINLPRLQSKQIVRFIIDKCLYKTSDMNILKARLIHQYGKQLTEPIWKHALQLFYQDGFY